MTMTLDVSAKLGDPIQVLYGTLYNGMYYVPTLYEYDDHGYAAFAPQDPDYTYYYLHPDGKLYATCLVYDAGILVSSGYYDTWEEADKMRTAYLTLHEDEQSFDSSETVLGSTPLFGD